MSLGAVFANMLSSNINKTRADSFRERRAQSVRLASMGRMRAPSHKLQILDTIIEFVFILVMDNLACLQGSAKMLFHNISMFTNAATSNVNNAIPHSINAASAYIWNVIFAKFPKFSLAPALLTGWKRHPFSGACHVCNFTLVMSSNK